MGRFCPRACVWLVCGVPWACIQLIGWWSAWGFQFSGVWPVRGGAWSVLGVRSLRLGWSATITGFTLHWRMARPGMKTLDLLFVEAKGLRFVTVLAGFWPEKWLKLLMFMLWVIWSPHQLLQPCTPCHAHSMARLCNTVCRVGASAGAKLL